MFQSRVHLPSSFQRGSVLSARFAHEKNQLFRSKVLALQVKFFISLMPLDSLDPSVSLRVDVERALIVKIVGPIFKTTTKKLGRKGSCSFSQFFPRKKKRESIFGNVDSTQGELFFMLVKRSPKIV